MEWSKLSMIFYVFCYRSYAKIQFLSSPFIYRRRRSRGRHRHHRNSVTLL